MERKRAVILVEAMYEDMEFWYPHYRLREEGYEVQVVAPEKGATYTSKHGYPVVSDAVSGEIDIDSIAIVVVPGGYAPDKLRRYPEILDFLKTANDKGKTIGTICHAVWVPISAGITKGKKMTCVSAIKDDLINSGAEFVDEALVIDGNLVSSRTPDDLPVFVKGLIKNALN